MKTERDINGKATVLQEWLEFKTSEYATRQHYTYVNLKREEISEVIAPYDTGKYSDREWCTIVMKNGNKYDVNIPYEKVMEMV